MIEDNREKRKKKNIQEEYRYDLNKIIIICLFVCFLVIDIYKQITIKYLLYIGICIFINKDNEL